MTHKKNKTVIHADHATVENFGDINSKKTNVAESEVTILSEKTKVEYTDNSVNTDNSVTAMEAHVAHADTVRTGFADVKSESTNVEHGHVSAATADVKEADVVRAGHATVQTQSANVEHGNVTASTAAVAGAGLVKADHASIQTNEASVTANEATIKADRATIQSDMTFVDKSRNKATFINTDKVEVVNRAESKLGRIGRGIRTAAAAMILVGVPTIAVMLFNQKKDVTQAIKDEGNATRHALVVSDSTRKADMAHTDSLFAVQKEDISAGTNEMHRQVHNHAEEVKKLLKTNMQPAQAVTGTSPGPVVLVPAN